MSVTTSSRRAASDDSKAHGSDRLSKNPRSLCKPRCTHADTLSVLCRKCCMLQIPNHCRFCQGQDMPFGRPFHCTPPNCRPLCLSGQRSLPKVLLGDLRSSCSCKPRELSPMIRLAGGTKRSSRHSLSHLFTHLGTEARASRTLNHAILRHAVDGLLTQAAFLVLCVCIQVATPIVIGRLSGKRTFP